MKSKSSLIKKIWLYLSVFSIIILIFLWLFQVIFLNSYYTWVKTNDITKIAKKVEESFLTNDYEDLINIIAYKQDVCIDIISDDKILYSSQLNRKCINTIESQNLYKKFISSYIIGTINKGNYQIKDSKFKNRILVTGVKLSNNSYAFISTTLEPLESTINILIGQLVYVSLLVLILSFLIAYYISIKISDPIIKINKKAKRMSKGDYDFKFKTDSKISEIIELTDTLDAAKEELKKTDDLRKELMANISHDLKTPLTMIKAYAEMVRDVTYSDSEKRTSNLNKIIEETDRLNLLVNDILDLSKIESVKELEQEEFDLNELIKIIISRFECFSNIKFQYNYNEVLNVYADKKKIEQVIYNLISNAINYVGKDNKIIINIINRTNTYIVQIIDHGKGIEEEEIDKIWDKYYKIDKSHVRNQFGTGLGLSIVKGILEQHNFNYGVESKKNKGTTFYFEITKK